MPQPVQPPETPAIVQSVSTNEAVTLDQASIETAGTSLSRSLLTGAIPTPTPPESFAPESSPLRASKSAALLGPPISIGYAIQPAETSLRGSASQESNDKRTYLVANRSASLTRPTSPRSESSIGEEKTLQASKPSDSSPSSSLSVTLGTQNVKRLMTQVRGGETREFDFTIPQSQTQPTTDAQVTPTPNQDETNPQPTPTPQPSPTPTPGTPIPSNPFGTGGVIELTADRQEYDDQRKVITAQGNVVLRFREALLNADQVEVNLPNRIIVAEGNVSLTRGQQVLRGQRFEYYFVQDSGVILNARGELYTPTAGTDLSLLTPDGTVGGQPGRPLSDRIAIDRPLQGISNPGGYSFVVGAGRTAQNLQGQKPGGTINRFRYEAERIDFDGPNAIAQNVRITNDPFSPPELELRADTARFTRLEPLVDEIVATRPRIVLDQGLELPTFRNRIRIDRRPREPGLFNIGYDQEDRGGLFIERSFEVFNSPTLRFSVTPQYFIQKAIFDEGVVDPSVFGVRARVDGNFDPRTILSGRAVLTTLDPTDFEENFRASLRLQRVIGTTLPHTLSLEYSYRDRLFNGSLGFQTVRSSIGAVLSSPNIPLGNTGVNLYYQAGAQYINSETDRADLLGPNPSNNRISLARYQGLVSLSKSFSLWRGQPLPPTPTEGLRYTPTPVVPYLSLTTAATGVGSFYSNGDTQQSISGTIGLVGQIGHFSRPYLDYTGFNLTYTQVALGNQSPFLFDRVADTKILGAGITQQVYGPFRIGFQTYINLDTGNEISTDYLLEYSRRTYNILLRYNPVQQLGSFSIRINDFNWTGNPEPFEGSNVIQGVTQDR
jgi:lipopolysaccharide export system protein LptA